MTWADLHDHARAQLASDGLESPEAEARWMVEEVSGLSRAELLAEAHAPVPEQARDAVATMLERRAAGEPLQYILGHWSFRHVELFVDDRVLIPRPETEWLVETALESMVAAGYRRGSRDSWTGTTAEYPIADLGTGSGAIAIALADELPDAVVWATDVSEDALAVARANVAGRGATRVRLTQGSWFEALPAHLMGELRLIISNPPYIGSTEWESLEPSVRDHEPFAALVAGSDGFEAVAELIDAAFVWLHPGGALVIEMAPHQTERACALATERGYQGAQVSYDLAARARALVATKPKEVP